VKKGESLPGFDIKLIPYNPSGSWVTHGGGKEKRGGKNAQDQERRGEGGPLFSCFTLLFPCADGGGGRKREPIAGGLKKV